MPANPGTYPHLEVALEGPVGRITLNRPAVHNAFDPVLIGSLQRALTDLGMRRETRAIVITGAGPSFCAGADISWMRDSLKYSDEQNLADALALHAMLDAVHSCPKPVVARVNGAAIGGGAGLVAACDLAVAATEARFGFTEVRLGIVPAVVAPFVVPRIGFAQARALFLTGERIAAERAREIGLVQTVAAPDELDQAVETLVQHLLHGGPEALALAKELVDEVWAIPYRHAAEYTVRMISLARSSAEGQEGLRAFLEKRRPTWLEDEG